MCDSALSLNANWKIGILLILKSETDLCDQFLEKSRFEIWSLLEVFVRKKKVWEEKGKKRTELTCVSFRVLIPCRNIRN